MPLLIDTCEHR